MFQLTQKLYLPVSTGKRPRLKPSLSENEEGGGSCGPKLPIFLKELDFKVAGHCFNISTTYWLLLYLLL